MVRQFVAICIVFAFAFAQSSGKAIESDIEVTYVKDITEFMLQNPGLELEPLIPEVEAFGDAPTPYFRLTHRLGSRINGDRLLASDSASQSWSKKQDVNLALHYPKEGYGKVITYLEIVVDQSSNIGQAFVTDGGIGQRKIALVVQARDTLYFNHKATIYGY